MPKIHRFFSNDAFGGLPSFVLSLADKFPGALSSEIASKIRERLDKDIEDDAHYTAELMQQNIDAANSPKLAQAAAQRLSSPRFVTTPRGERRRIIAKNMLASANELANHLGPAIDAALRIKLLEFEIVQEDIRDEIAQEAKQIKIDTQLYKSVKVVSDELYQKHGINHNHWKAVSDGMLDSIAKILLSTNKAAEERNDAGDSDGAGD